MKISQMFSVKSPIKVSLGRETQFPLSKSISKWMDDGSYNVVWRKWLEIVYQPIVFLIALELTFVFMQTAISDKRWKFRGHKIAPVTVR